MKKNYITLMTFCLITIFLLNLSLVSAFLDIKHFDKNVGKYGQIEVDDWLFFNKADYLLTDYGTSVINAWAEGEYKLYKKTHLFTGVFYKDMVGKKGELKDVKFFIWEIKSETKYNPTYENKNCYITTNGTSSEVCESVLISNESYQVDVSGWIPYEKGMDLEESEGRWRLEAKRKPNKQIDFILEAHGKEFVEWAWWNQTWEYKKPIIVNTSSDLTDYQFNYTIDYTANMKSDFGDIRFTYYNSTTATETELYYWNETIYASDNVTMWIKSNFSTGNNTIYMYYGNAGASTTSSGTNTFIQYHGSTTTQYLDALVIYNNYVYEARVKTTSDPHHPQFGVTNNIGNNDDYIMFDVYTNGATGYVANENSNTNTGAQPPLWTDDVWHRLKAEVSATGVKFYDNNETLIGGSEITSNLPNENGGLHMRLVAGTAEQEWAFLRLYTPTPPTILETGAEEDNNQLTITSISPINHYNSTSTNISFECNGTDETGLYSLNLTINGTVYEIVTGAGNTNLTLSSTETLSDGYYEWYCIGNDNTETKNSTTRYLTVDSIPPAPTIIYPTATNYSTNVTELNYNVIEEHPGSCWITSDFYCYQESVSISNQTGIDGNCNLNYSGNVNDDGKVGHAERFIDGSWGSSSYIFTTYNATTYVNYTKPEGAIDNSLWKIKNVGGTKNVTIYSDCFNQSILQFKIFQEKVNPNLYRSFWYCYNGTTWRLKDLQTSANPDGSGSYIWEDAMWWNFGAEPLSSGTNFTDLVSFEGTNTWDIHCNDTFGHENESAVTFNVDTINPLVELIYPTATNYSTNITILNFSISDVNLNTCWYSVNNTINITTNCSENITGLTSTEGSNTWTIYANDTFGHENESAVTFNVDTITPNVSSANNLTDLTPYSLPTNSIWNYIVIDPHTDKCYFNTTENATQTIITCNSSITTTWATEGNKTIQYCANDTFGYETCRTDYIFINYVQETATYDAIIIEQETTTLILNITATNINSFNGTLHYHGTDYTPTITNDSTEGILTATITTPFVSNNTLVYFNWTYTLNGVDHNSSNYNQTIMHLTDLIISASCDDKALRFDLQDEGNLSAIYGNIDYNFQYGISNNSLKTAYGSLNNITTFYVCINASVSENYTIGYGEIQYSDGVYVPRRFYLFEGKIISNNTLTNHTLRDLLSTDQTSFLLTFEDTSLNVYDNKYTALWRWYPDLNEYQIVEMGKTDEDGQTVSHVDTEDVDYRVGLYHLNGTLIKLGDPLRFLCTSAPCSFTLRVGAGDIDYSSLFDVQTALTYNETSEVFTFIYNDPNQFTSLMRLLVTRETGSSTLTICDITSSGFTGVMSCNTSMYTGLKKAVVYRSASPPIVIAQKLVSDLNTTFNSGFGLFISLFLWLAIVLSGFGNNPIWTIILGVVGLIPALIIGSINLTIFTGIAILGAIIIHFIKRTVGS